MNILIPMAGRGQRFVDAGYEKPKPLINVNGEPMYSLAVQSLPIELCSSITFLCLKQHLESGELEADLKQRYSNYNLNIVSVEQVTQGQACTALLAEEFINNDEQLIIYNADTYFESELKEKITGAENCDGIISVIEVEGSQWSFAKINDNDVIVETAEKERISPWATTGMYHFTRGKDFVYFAKRMIKEQNTINNEYYIAPIYNYLIAEGMKIIPDYASTLKCMGTPEELKIFLNS